MDAKTAKAILTKYIEKEFVSVRTKQRRGTSRDIKGKYHTHTWKELDIKIRTDKSFNPRIGVEQAYASREALSEHFDLFFYGRYAEDGLTVLEPHSVRVTVKR